VTLEQHEEEALLERSLDGDREAFGRLLELHHGRALALALNLVGRREDARDLVQEAALKAWRGLPGFVRGRPFFPWYYRILRNACIQHLRGARLRRTRSLAGEAEELRELDDPSGLRPEDLVEAEEQSRILARALADLPRADAELLLLKHQQGLSYREIAETLGIPAGTVMSRLYTARRRLRALVPELG